MKKNLVFKLGLFCAALVLVATCFVTNAWAKYTKSVTASDSARVAKFAFTVKEGTTVFDNTQEIDVFGTKMTNILNDPDADALGVKLLAPGSTGEFKIVLSNASEVALDFTLTADEVNTQVDYDHDNDPATPTQKIDIPLVWTWDGHEYETLDLALKAADGTGSGITIAEGGADREVTIGWKWVFSEDETQDKIDTALGEYAAKGIAVTYTVVIKVTATQVVPVPVA